MKNQTRTKEAKYFKLQIRNVVFSWKTWFLNRNNLLSESICGSLFKLDDHFKINFVGYFLLTGFPRYAVWFSDKLLIYLLKYKYILNKLKAILTCVMHLKKQIDLLAEVVSHRCHNLQSQILFFEVRLAYLVWKEFFLSFRSAINSSSHQILFLVNTSKVIIEKAN